MVQSDRDRVGTVEDREEGKVVGREGDRVEGMEDKEGEDNDLLYPDHLLDRDNLAYRDHNRRYHPAFHPYLSQPYTEEERNGYHNSCLLVIFVAGKYF